MSSSCRAQRFACALWGLLLASAGLGCGGEPKAVTVPATQVTVSIYTEPQVRAVTAYLYVRTFVQEGGDWKQSGEKKIYDFPDDFAADEARDAGSEAVSPQPVQVVVVPRGNDASRTFEIIVEARDASDLTVVEQRASLGFLPQQNLGLRLDLQVCKGLDLGRVCETDGDCHGPQCKTCKAGGCKPAMAMDPEKLPDVKAMDDQPPMPPPPTCSPNDACAFECVGEPRSKESRDATATLRVRVVDYKDGGPLKPRVASCNAERTECVPREVSYEKNTGNIVIGGLPQGFNGFFTFDADGHLPVDFYSLRPLYDSSWEPAPILMLTPDLLEKVGKIVPIDLQLGAIAARVFDCYALSAPRVAFSVTSATVLYVDEHIDINLGADTTDRTGQAVAFNIEKPEVTLTATRDRKVINASVLDPAPGRLTYVHVYPERR